MKIGVFGGTFDPIHIGHLIVAEEARVLLDLDEVLFIPAGQPWLKTGQPITEARHRMEMVMLAVESNPYFRASGIEIARQGPTYTVDTLADLHKRSDGQMQVFLPMGLDLLYELGKWRQPERIFEVATVVGIPRPGFEGFDLSTLDSIAPGVSRKVVMLNVSLIGISSTEIRRSVAQGQSIRYRVPESVERYIAKHALYRGKG